ncbi:histidine kinase [Undibacterium sp. CY18W]|uniref:Histidine kinase n=1 Tax=Undibacterium hunanense TaxID=2762292 RepID=A0ABR6ZQQ5_9BURK|nr:histidine kinase [Undibacterium hunanense]MBC3918208.1 histidine kinase [Undibacterium hunanense]
MNNKLLQQTQTYLQSRLKPEHYQSLVGIIGDMPRLLAINTTCGFAVTFVLRGGGTLFQNILFSMFIGFSAYSLIKLFKRLFWGAGTPNTIGFYLMCVMVAPLALLVGMFVAAVTFNYPLPDISKFRWSYMGGVVTLTCFVSLIAAWSFWNRSKMSELQASAEAEKAKNAAIEKQAMQAQLQMLQAQIEPHMLFNTLANLQGLIAIDPPRAQHMLAQLIVYLRNTLSSSRAEQTTLKQEFTLMQAYLELLAIRMGKRLHYTLDLPDDLQHITIAPMLLQPLVENAIKHGLEPKMEGGSIHVVAEKLGTQLHLKIIDTGLGLPFNYDDNKNISSTDQHVGNANIRERLLALYGPQASLSLQANQPEGAIAHLTIPL